MIDLYPVEYAFTSTLEGQEFHLHEDQVIKDLMILAPFPNNFYKVVISEKRIAPACAS
jgi:hypothetical protein